MKINNESDFINVIRNYRLLGVAPEIDSLINCINELGRMCACDPPNAITAKRNQCKSLYLIFANKSNQYKSILFSKIGDAIIEFCIDNQPIARLTR